VFDFHVHVWVPEFIPLPIRMSWAENAAYRKDPPRDPASILPRVTAAVSDPEGEHLLKAMEVAGIDAAAIMAVDYALGAGEEAPIPLPEVLERYAGICAKSKGRLFYFASVDPRRENGVALAKDALMNRGALGLKIYPPSGFRAGDPLCFPLYDLLRETHKVAVVHTSPVAGRLSSYCAWPMHISDAMARYQDVPFVLAHSGWPCWWDEVVALASHHPRTYLELSLWDREAPKDWGAFAAKLAAARDTVGADRIMFASDTMFGSNYLPEALRLKRWADGFRELSDGPHARFSAEEVALMTEGNARRLIAYARGNDVSKEM
jgi:predicted TIM-barrel fold metal-dependent hydrolase